MPRRKYERVNPGPDTAADKILALLTEFKVLTRFSMGELLPEIPRSTLSEGLRFLHRTKSRWGMPRAKRVYISGWVRDDQLGEAQTYLRPLYRLGNRPDAPKPPALTGLQREQTYRAKKRIGRGVANSVFALGDACS